jgi:hypothetical protein
VCCEKLGRLRHASFSSPCWIGAGLLRDCSGITCRTMGHVLSAARKSRRSVISFCNTALAAKFGFGPCGSRVSKPLLHLLLLFFRTAGLRAVKPSQNPCADGASSFWQGVMWATKAVRLGYRWKMGNGKRIRFWEDLWLGSIQFWELYCIVNKKCMIIVELWDEQS